MRVEHRLDIRHMRVVEREIDAEQRRRLQVDAAAPALARLGERPAKLMRVCGPTLSIWVRIADVPCA